MSYSISGYSDQQLLSMVARGDSVAFEEIYRRHWQILFNAAYKRLKSIDQCKDILQDVFIDLWTRRATLEIENLHAYLFAAVRYQVYKRIAAGKATSSFFDPFQTIISSPFESANNVADKELAELAKAWLETLPDKRKEIFILHFVDKLSTHQIAEKLHVSQKTVQNQLGTASKSLRKKILSVSIFPF